MQVYCTVPTLVSICTYLYVFAQHPLAGVSTVHVALPQSAVGVSSARPGMATGDWRDNLGPRFPVPGTANTYDHAPLPPPSLVPGPEAEPPPWSAISRLVPAQPPLPRSQVPAEVPCRTPVLVPNVCGMAPEAKKAPVRPLTGLGDEHQAEMPPLVKEKDLACVCMRCAVMCMCTRVCMCVHVCLCVLCVCDCLCM